MIPYFLNVFVDGKPEMRDVESLELQPRGKMPIPIPQLKENEEIVGRTLCGKIYVQTRPVKRLFLVSVVADWSVDGMPQTYTAEFSDGSVETWSAEMFYEWKASEREW